MRVLLLLLVRVLSSLPSNADAVDAVDAAALRRSGSASAKLKMKSKQAATRCIAGPLATVARLHLGRLARYIRCGLAGIFVAMSMFTSAPFLLQTIPSRGVQWVFRISEASANTPLRRLR